MENILVVVISAIIGILAGLVGGVKAKGLIKSSGATTLGEALDFLKNNEDIKTIIDNAVASISDEYESVEEAIVGVKDIIIADIIHFLTHDLSIPSTVLDMITLSKVYEVIDEVLAATDIDERITEIVEDIFDTPIDTDDVDEEFVEDDSTTDTINITSSIDETLSEEE